MTCWICLRPLALGDRVVTWHTDVGSAKVHLEHIVKKAVGQALLGEARDPSAVKPSLGLSGQAEECILRDDLLAALERLPNCTTLPRIS